MDEADEIKRRKYEEMRQRQQDQQQSDQQQTEGQSQQEMQEAQKQAILRTLLTADARERLVRIKMARPDFGAQVENLIIQLAQQGRITQKIDEEMLKSILRQLQGQKRDYTIHRR
jgi:programmed cell death protein 5